jgi:hypothetical protein
MPTLKRQSGRTRCKPPAPNDPLAALRADPAVRAADPAARAWLLGLLANGEHAEQQQTSAK